MNNLIEALMYIKGEDGLSPKELKTVMEIPTAEARSAIKQFAKEFNAADRGIFVMEFNDIFKLATRKEYKENITKLVAIVKVQKLSGAAIETAGIIAYKQPITKSQINDIRGVASEAVVNTLLVKGIIQEVGIAQTPGSPVLFGISNKFYDYFNISSLKELPELSEFNEVVGPEDGFDLFASQRED